MKKLLSYIFGMLTIFSLMGCGSDGGPEEIPQPASGECISVKLQLGVAASSESTRAGYSDSFNSSGEWMKSWFVVIASNHQIDTIITNHPYASGEQERALDDCWVRLKPGKHVFYSFANIQPAQLGLEGKKRETDCRTALTSISIMWRYPNLPLPTIGPISAMNPNRSSRMESP